MRVKCVPRILFFCSKHIFRFDPHMTCVDCVIKCAPDQIDQITWSGLNRGCNEVPRRNAEDINTEEAAPDFIWPAYYRSGQACEAFLDPLSSNPGSSHVMNRTGNLSLSLANALT